MSAEDWALVEVIQPLAVTLTNSLVGEGRITRLLVEKPFPKTDALSLNARATHLVKRFLVVANIVASFVEKDARLDPLLLIPAGTITQRPEKIFMPVLWRH